MSLVETLLACSEYQYLDGAGCFLFSKDSYPNPNPRQVQFERSTVSLSTQILSQHQHLEAVTSEQVTDKWFENTAHVPMTPIIKTIETTDFASVWRSSPNTPASASFLTSPQACFDNNDETIVASFHIQSRCSEEHMPTSVVGKRFSPHPRMHRKAIKS